MIKKLSIIAAVASNGAIGKNNDLLWHLSADLKYFKKLTTEHTIIMGRKTFESFPNGPLPNRKHIVLSSKELKNTEQCIFVNSIEEALQHCSNEENFVIGGGTVYKMFLPLVNKMYLTYINKEFKGDTFFPDYDKTQWLITEGDSHFDDKSGLEYRFDILIRKS